MAGEFPEVPNEAKSFNDMVAWAAKNGQAESAHALIESVKSQDWDSALGAVHKLEEMSELADKAGAVGDYFDTIDKVGKVIEIADAVEKGDYAWATAKVGAEVVDQVASGYLDSLGPGGIMVNYAAHEAGDVMSSYVTEAQQFGPNAQLANASGDEAVVAAYKNNREHMEAQIREQVEAGRSPEDVAGWAKDHMEAHGAIYKNLDELEGRGEAFANRFEKDLEWSSDMIETASKEVEAQPAPGADGGEQGFFSRLMEAGAERLDDLKESIIETLQPDEPAEPAAEPVEDKVEPEPEAVSEPVAERQPDQPEAVPEPVAREPEPVPTVEAQTNIDVNLEITVVQGDISDAVIEAQPVEAEPVQTEPTQQQRVEPQPTTERTTAVEPEIPEIPLAQSAANETILPPIDPAQPPPATEVMIDDSELTETEKLDAYVSQMARDAEAQDRADALAEQGLDTSPPPATEVVVVDDDAVEESEVYDIADPWDEGSISENFDDNPDDSSHVA